MEKHTDITNEEIGSFADKYFGEEDSLIKQDMIRMWIHEKDMRILKERTRSSSRPPMFNPFVFVAAMFILTCIIVGCRLLF
jgi:hypothetical protein